MDKQRLKQRFEKLKSRAASIANDPNRLDRLLQSAREKSRNSQQIQKIRDDFLTLLRMIGQWVRGRYRAVPWPTLVSAVASIMYFVNPFDLIPDFIAGAGLLDDITVLTWVLSAMHKDLERFRDWESSSADYSQPSGE